MISYALSARWPPANLSPLGYRPSIGHGFSLSPSLFLASLAPLKEKDLDEVWLGILMLPSGRMTGSSCEPLSGYTCLAQLSLDTPDDS